MKLLTLRRPDTCATCSAAQPVGTRAWWDSTAKHVICLACRGGAEAVAALSDGEGDGTETIAEVPPLTDEERGVAGRSARAERVRRSTKRSEGTMAAHPKLGRVILAVTDDPRSTKVWDQGAAGEEKVAEVLEAARPRGIEHLADRRIPKSKANIDHLVISPSGVWVVDAKRYLNGKLERRDVGGFFKTDVRLYVGGRDKSSLLQGVRKQMDKVSVMLAETPFADAPVHGALCFVDAELGWFAKPFSLDGISVTWRKHLVAPMLATDALDEGTRLRLARVLADAFPPA